MSNTLVETRRERGGAASPSSQRPAGHTGAVVRYVLGALLAGGAVGAGMGSYLALANPSKASQWIVESGSSRYLGQSLLILAVTAGVLLLAAVAVLRSWKRARLLAFFSGVLVLAWLLTRFTAVGWISWTQPVVAIGALSYLALAAVLPGKLGVRGLSVDEVALKFLSEHRIAVTGVSRKPKGHGSNTVYKRLRTRGYQVFAVNPNAAVVEGDPSYPNLKSIPGGVTAVVIGTRAETAEATVRECGELGIKWVWMHRAFGPGSVSKTASRLGNHLGITVIEGGCPCMFGKASDPGHKLMRRLLALTQNVPKRVAPPVG